MINHVAGYTPFTIPLDKSFVNFGIDNPNTIAVFVDPDNGEEGGKARGSGWWYEGGGLYRNVRLVRTSNVHFINKSGLFVHSQVRFDNSKKQPVSADLTADIAISNDGQQDEEVCISVEVINPDHALLQALSYEPSTIAKGQNLTISLTTNILQPRLWTTRAPNLYTVKALLKACSTGKEVDMLSAHHGFRSIRFDANEGFLLNEEHYKIRGFCDHSSFSVVGMAVPPRLNLFRVRTKIY